MAHSENFNDDPEQMRKVDEYLAECRIPKKESPIDLAFTSPPITASWITKDSGSREEFSTGARRDDGGQKTRYDLIPVCALRRLADLYARGAHKYGEHNYQKGMPLRRVFASLLRHAYDWAVGDRSEDHLAAVAWNAFALIFYEEEIQAGRLPRNLDNMDVLPKETDSE